MRQIRPVLEERCQGLCEKCGTPLHRDESGRYIFEAHHRKKRSAGGTDEVHSLLALHPRCHHQHRRSVHDNPKQANENGWMVPAWADPATTSVLVMGRWVLLHPDGSWSSTEKTEEVSV